MRLSNPKFYDLMTKVFWSSVFALMAIFLYFSLFVFTLPNSIILLGLMVTTIAVIGVCSFRYQKLMLDRRTLEIREAARIHEATVEALATAIDARDQMGRGHVSRTQTYAVRIGELLRLSPKEIEGLKIGALLHDIGKLAVPDQILNKPGPLTPAELEKTKVHVSVGAAILSKIDFPYPVVPTVKHHHERWDGSGYPDRLQGEEIPLTARILAVVDSYDTLRRNRPYRPPVGRDDARKALRNGAGNRFDPRIVEIFLRNLKQWEAEIEQQGLSYASETETNAPVTIDSVHNEPTNFVDQIKRANREVITLYELARVFGTSLNLEDTLSLFVRKISEFVPFDTCVVYLLNETGSVAIAKHAEGLNADSLKNRKVEVGQGATGFTLEHGKPVTDVSPGLDFSSYEMEFVESYRSMVSLPLVAKGKLIGAVSVYSSDQNRYEDEHMRLLETISRIASDAIAVSIMHTETEISAFTDLMTGLPNARSLQKQFDIELARARRNGTIFQVLMIDLDGFKAVNDSYGHKIGDRMLAEISQVMKQELRDYDFLARYAGDEFVAIVPETDNKGASELCERIEDAVNEFRLEIGDGEQAGIGVSIGAASYPSAGDTLDKIVIAADKAMYAIKKRRKSLPDESGAAVMDDAKNVREKVAADKAASGHEADDGTLIVELDERFVISDRVN